jgi:hypothetical protein
MIVCKLDLQLPVCSVPITTKVVSSNPVHSEVYSMQHYVYELHVFLIHTYPEVPSVTVTPMTGFDH